LWEGILGFLAGGASRIRHRGSVYVVQGVLKCFRYSLSGFRDVCLSVCSQETICSF
jgi:hypothetical protein